MHNNQQLSATTIRISIIFQDPGSDPFPGVLRSGSISYSNEHNKINWKGPTDKENKVKMYKSTVLVTLPL
jgi:hypothetical protein